MAGQRTSDRTGDQALLRAQEYLTEIGDRLTISGTTGEASSRRIFDAGLPGLEFFRLFGPSYARFRDKSFTFESDILARYNAQREIGFSKLYADADRFGQLCSTMTESDLDYRNSANSLFDNWQGNAADRAKARVTGFLTSAGSIWAGINGFGSTLRTACRAAERIAFDKAKAVLALATDTVGGLTAENVELLVDVALLASGAAMPNDYLADMAELADVTVNPTVCRSNPDVLNMVLDSAHDWLQHAFVPAYEARLAVFQTACERAQADLDHVWASVSTAIGDLAEHSVGRFDTLRNQPAPTPAGSLPAPSVVPAAPPPATRDSPATEHRYPTSGGGSSIAARLDPQPTDPQPVDPQPGPAPAGVLNSDAGAGTDNNTQHHDTGTPGTPPDQPTAEHAATAAPGYGAGSFMQPPRMASGGGGGEREHKRKVPVKGNPMPAQPESAAPTGVIGAAEDPAAYNEAERFDDDSRLPRQPISPAEPEPLVEQKKPEPPPTVWRLTEDGEIESVLAPPPKTDTQNSSS